MGCSPLFGRKIDLFFFLSSSILKAQQSNDNKLKWTQTVFQLFITIAAFVFQCEPLCWCWWMGHFQFWQLLFSVRRMNSSVIFSPNTNECKKELLKNGPYLTRTRIVCCRICNILPWCHWWIHSKPSNQLDFVFLHQSVSGNSWSLDQIIQMSCTTVILVSMLLSIVNLNDCLCL